MPALYAHDAFGRKVAAKLPTAVKKAVLQYPQLFRIGLQGPDILFFYNPFRKNEIGQNGREIHRQSVLTFFENARKQWLSGGKRPEQLSYLMGFLCHFMLDSTVHGFINAQTSFTGVSHIAIETEFDRMILTVEKKQANAFPVGHCIPDAEGLGSVIAPFYPDRTAGQIEHSIRSMRFFKNLLVLPRKATRETVYGGLRLIKQYDSLSQHIMPPEADLRCRLACETLYKMLEKAVFETVQQQKLFWKAMHAGCDFDPRLDRNFE